MTVNCLPKLTTNR